MRIMSEKEYNALIITEYVKGYKAGYQAGVHDDFMESHTINDIRKILGMEPVITCNSIGSNKMDKSEAM